MIKDEHDIESIATVLNRAFVEDPLLHHFFPDDASRLSLAQPTFRLVARQTQAFGVSETIAAADGEMVGAALWLPSDHVDIGLLELLRFGGLSAVLHQGVGASWRQLVTNAKMLKLHHQLLPEKHWYLIFLGLLPEARGKGLATKLVEPMLERADREGVPCYLDTHNGDNVPLYRRYGFRVAHEWVLPGTNLRHWAMIRDLRRDA